MNDEATQIATKLAEALETAWNAGDGQAFGSNFAEGADFVDIRGEYHTGRTSIAIGHQAILDTLYKGSSVVYDVVNARTLAPGVVSAQVAATLNVPAGPMAGENHAFWTLIALQHGDAWQIEVFHNTLIPPQMNSKERQIRDAIR